MDKKIIQHYNATREDLDLKDETSQDFWRDYLNYHQQKVQNFQHERQIHLLVTLFWSFLTLFFGFLIIFLPNVFSGVDGNIAGSIQLISIIIFLLFFIVELFYLRYYYRLENGISKLYDLNDHIFNKIKQ
ncbi:hypothetical protein KBE88_03480 [Candidatus Saccharibacteria bacterium]|nr:hypothetical protein [Candidatus Saccharibacteria bacterium]